MLGHEAAKLFKLLSESLESHFSKLDQLPPVPEELIMNKTLLRTPGGTLVVVAQRRPIPPAPQSLPVRKLKPLAWRHLLLTASRSFRRFRHRHADRMTPGSKLIW